MAQLLSYFDLGEAELAVAKAARIAVVLLLAWLLQRIASRLIAAFHRYMAARLAEPGRLFTVERAMRYVATVLIVLVAGTAVLAELGISVLPILATAGVAGIAVGFGAQSLIKDYFNGFFLLLEDQLRQGDVVEIAGRSGTVEELTLRYVRLRDFDGNLYFVPNSEIKLVMNRTRGYARAVADAVIKTGQDVDAALQAMRDVGRALREDPAFAPLILEDVEVAGIDRWEHFAVFLRARLKVAPGEQWRVRAEYMRRVKIAFEERGILIP